MDFQDDNSNGDPQNQNIQNMLDDLGLGQQNNFSELSKKDTTIFIIDCSAQITQIFQNQQDSQLKMIFDGYSNFLQRKIIANIGDQVGLILYNVKNQNISNFKNIYVVHKLGQPSAMRIKQANNLYKQFEKLTGGIQTQSRATLQHVLWTYSDQIKKHTDSKYYLRLFLFTPNDNPHQIGSEERMQAINQAHMLSDKNVQIQLFPLRKSRTSIFNIAKFYQQIITLDPEEINQTVLDSSSKILDLKQRLRQKQFKKRTLNRLLMKIGNQTNVGVKLYSMYTKAKKPVPKKVDATSNRPLQRVTKKLNRQGKVMFDGQIGTYYPLGGEKIKFSKQDMNKVKNIQPPGMTLIGFKPKKYIKPYYNLKSSYFLYPDQEHVNGSSQFCDALINELCQRNLVGIVKIVPRNNQQIYFAALFPQKQQYNEQNHCQIPPGFNMIILPYADDIVNFVGEKTVCKPMQISKQLIDVTSLLVNSLTINDFDFRSFENPSLQKFYSHLQALALGEKNVEERPDLLLPDQKGLQNFRQIIELLMETVQADQQHFNAKRQHQDQGMMLQNQVKIIKRQDGIQDDKKQKKGVQKKSRAARGAKKNESNNIKQQIQLQQQSQQQFNKAKGKNAVKSTVSTKAKSQNQSLIVTEQSQQLTIINSVQTMIINGQIQQIKVADLKKYLKYYKQDDKGKKQVLINRALVFISERVV